MKNPHVRKVGLRWYLDEVACYVPPCNVEASGQVGQGEALVHGTDVSDAVTRVDHHPGQKSWNNKVETSKCFASGEGQSGEEFSNMDVQEVIRAGTTRRTTTTPEKPAETIRLNVEADVP